MKRLFQDPQIKFELGESFKSILLQPDMTQTMVELLTASFKHPESQRGMNQLLEQCFHKVLLDQDTLEKFRIFVYNLMTLEIEEGQAGGAGAGKKATLLELLLSKAVNKQTARQADDIQSLIEKRKEEGLEKLKLKSDSESTQCPPTSQDNKSL